MVIALLFVTAPAWIIIALWLMSKIGLTGVVLLLIFIILGILLDDSMVKMDGVENKWMKYMQRIY